MNPNRNPVIVVVPAAWHQPIHYRLWTDELNQAGYQTVIDRLPSCGSSNPQAQSVSGDAEFVRQRFILPSIDAGREVVVAMHSYGGGPGSMAAKGFSLAERSAAGEPGGIIGLIYISALIAQAGQTLLGAGGDQFAPWVIDYASDLIPGSSFEFRH